MADEVAAVDDEYETLGVSVGDRVPGVATIELDRPDARNALNATIRNELKDLLDVVEMDDSVRVVVLTGSPEGRVFAAGADIKELRERDAIDQREVSRRPRIYERVDGLSKPVIARINGHALGGGCELVQACDVRIAHERAKLGQPEINLGIMPGGGGTQRLPRLVGEGKALQLILTGELIDAEGAHDIGLVDECYDDEEAFDDRVYEVAGMMANKSPLALQLNKKAVKSAARMDLEQGIEYEVELFLHLIGSEDKDEGVSAFLEDREPEWQGR